MNCFSRVLVKEQKRQRVLALDILKFLAVFFVINSHADSLYPTEYRALATGGTIGDGLFLFCSGYALFLGQKRSFSDYFKRRIQRIWPSLFISVIVLALLYQFGVHLVDFIGRSFIRALFVYYILIFFINQYLSKQLKPLMIGLAVVSVVAYAILYPLLVVKRDIHPEMAIYYFKWMPYFCFMLLGLWVSKQKEKNRKKTWLSVLFTLVGITLFYAIQFGSKLSTSFAPFLFLSILPLLWSIRCLFEVCSGVWAKKLMQNRVSYFVIMLIGGLCLEVYLVQYDIIASENSNSWPVNLLIVFLKSLVCAYVVRCLARFFLQTFRTERYDWRKMMDIVS